MRLTIDGKPYGEYPFAVKSGLIQFQGKQVRETTDPMVYIVDYLSGGRLQLLVDQARGDQVNLGSIGVAHN